MRKWWGFLGVLAMAFPLAGAQIFNEDFASAEPGTKIPPGWNNYGKQDLKNFTEIIRHTKYHITLENEIAKAIEYRLALIDFKGL